MTKPLVSVIIPVRNEERYIKDCLDRIFSQTYPRDKIEVLVVDGMSDDKTRKIVSQFPVRILDNPKKIVPSAMNIGIKNSKGDIILRMDARTRISNDYVEKCVKTLLETGADNVGGVQKPLLEGGIVQRAIGLAMSHRFGVGDAAFRLGIKSGPVDTVYLGCFRKEALEKIGLFDEKTPLISDEYDVNYRIRKTGGVVYLNKDITAYYIPRASITALGKLYFHYGRLRAGFFRKHKVLRWRQLVPVAFVSVLAILPFLLAINSIISYRINYIINYIILFCLGILSGLYVLADIIVSMSIAAREKNIGIFFALLAVFPTMHFSWAIGFLHRLFFRPESGEYKKP